MPEYNIAAKAFYTFRAINKKGGAYESIRIGSPA